MLPARRPIALLTFSLSAVAGCGAFALEGFTGGEEPNDAGSEGASADVRGQEEEEDARTTEDGGVDAAADAVADPCVAPGFTTRICDGFERTQGVLTASSPENWTNTGNVLLVDDDAGTGKVASFAAGGDGGDTDSFLTLGAGDVRRATIRGRLRITTAPPSSYRQIMIMKFSGATTTAQVTISLSANNQITMNEQILTGGGGANHALPAFPSGWHRFTFDVDLVQKRASFSIDGVDALPTGETFPQLGNFPPTSSVTLGIGARYSPSTPLTDLQYDDVLLATGQ